MYYYKTSITNKWSVKTDDETSISGEIFISQNYPALTQIIQIQEEYLNMPINRKNFINKKVNKMYKEYGVPKEIYIAVSEKLDDGRIIGKEIISKREYTFYSNYTEVTKEEVLEYLIDLPIDNYLNYAHFYNLEKVKPSSKYNILDYYEHFTEKPYTKKKH